MTKTQDSTNCQCTGDEHLDARDSIYATISALHRVRVAAIHSHSLTREEGQAFDRVERLLRDRASSLSQHAYNEHGSQRMTRARDLQDAIDGVPA